MAVNEIKINSSYIADIPNYHIENDEWIHVIIDKSNHIMGGIKTDGSVEWSVGVPTPIREYLQNLKIENLDTTYDVSIGRKLIIDGNTITNINDDRLQITTDSEERIISYRDKNGKLYECVGINAPSISFDTLEFSEDNLSNFKK